MLIVEELAVVVGPLSVCVVVLVVDPVDSLVLVVDPVVVLEPVVVLDLVVLVMVASIASVLVRLLFHVLDVVVETSVLGAAPPALED